MDGRTCKLYDEDVVRSIMISTGMMLLQYVKDKDVVDEEDACEFIESNAEAIINEALEGMDNPTE